MTKTEARPLFALLAANLISFVGNSMTLLAIPWFVLETTGSASKTGLIAAVMVLAYIPGGIFGGVVADHLGFRRTSIVTDLVNCVAVAMIPLLYQTSGLQFWQLVVLVFFSHVVDASGFVSRMNLSPQLADRAGMSLDRANGLYQMTNRVAGLAGPPLAGVLIAAIGTSNVLWIDAVTFIASALIVVIAVPSGEAAAATTTAHKPSYLAEIREGLAYVRRDKVLLVLMLTFGFVGMLGEPVYTVILPVFVREVYGSSIDLGLIYGGLAVGSLAGNFIYIAVGARLPRRELIIFGFAVRAAIFWILLPYPPLVVVVLAVALCGLCLEPTNPMLMTVFQERIPEALRGRVMGILIALLVSIRPFGFIAYGVLIDEIGLRGALFVLATANLVVPAALFVLPALRELSRPTITRAAAPESPA